MILFLHRVGTIEKLYIRYPIKIEDEFAIRSLHPNIIAVHLPRQVRFTYFKLVLYSSNHFTFQQKSRRWCVVDFENKEKLEEARTALKKIKVEDKKIKFRPYQRVGVKNIKSEKTLSKESSTKSLVKLLKKDS